MAFPPASFFTGQLVTAAMMNANLRDNLNTLNSGGLAPEGLITLWGGAISIIPAGWGLCDGGGGRKDLRNYFPIGAGGTYAVDATGGAASVTPAAHTTHSVGGTSAHAAHALGNSDHGVTDAGGPPVGVGSLLGLPPGGHSGQSIDAHGAHSGAALSDAHTHNTISLLPPYHARAYMQLAATGLSFTTPRTWVTGDIPSAAQMNADARDNMNYLAARSLPLGTIVAWGLGFESIPSGWQLCDGSNGTPDLRDKFVVGAGSTYGVGDTGGALTASLGSHGSHTVTQPAAHADHVVGQPANHSNFVNDAVPAPGGTRPIIDVGAAHSTFAVDAHSAHTSFNASSHSSHATVDIVPPFLALCYMQLINLPPFTTPRTWVNGETVQAAQFNTYLRDNELAIQAAQAPVYTCAIWSGSIATIPSNWSLIGALFDRAILGAGNSVDGHTTYPTTGGAAGVTPAAHADHTVTQPSGHGSHVVTNPGAHPVGQYFGSGNSYLNGLNNHNFTVSAHDAHAFTVDAHSAHATITTYPPYKAVPFIERLS